MRTAGVNDAPAVGFVQEAIWRQVYRDVLPHEMLLSLTPQVFAQIWRDSLADPPEGVHRLLVACDGPRVVGFAAIGPSQDPDAGHTTAEITTLGVHPDARGRGHGSRLLNAAVDVLREAGATEAVTWVLAAHDDTRAFLTGSGFSADGAHRSRDLGGSGEPAREVRLATSLVDAEVDA